MTLFDKTIDTLSKSLDLHLLRQSVISDNIANAETPNFKARKVEFESELQSAVEATETGAMGPDILSVEANITQDPHSEMGQDLNTVDMDREMAAMTKNDVQYSAGTQMVNKKFFFLKYAIGEGRN
ncbi:flagellar basal body rod protein FlgB [bacterium]|nr:flagellar basal body rod protein FlgB [bacterium]